MDARKPTGRTVAELAPYFAALPEAGFCLDVAHVLSVDPSMEAGERLLDAFAGRLRHLHVSSVDEGCRHVPLTVEHETRYAELLRRCPDVPWILEAPLPESRAAGLAGPRRVDRDSRPRATIDPRARSSGSGPSCRPGRRARAEAVARRAALALPLRPRRLGGAVRLVGPRRADRAPDDDWALLVDGAERDVGPEPEALAAALGAAARAGRSGVFGGRIFCDDLLSRIGLDADSNTNLTRRMLLMLESQPVAGDAVHRRCWERVLDGYLEDADRPYRPPRFFLNDLIRYWRTICVDFVGKEREGGEKWGIRNAEAAHLAQGAVRRRARAAAAVPPLRARSAARTLPPSSPPRRPTGSPPRSWTAARDAGVRALSAYDRWLGVLDDEARRGELESLTKETAHESAVFRDVRRHATELHRGLLVLLFDTSCSRTCASTASSSGQPLTPPRGGTGGRAPRGSRRGPRARAARRSARGSPPGSPRGRACRRAACSSSRAAGSSMCTVV